MVISPPNAPNGRPPSPSPSENYHAIVDMGSNGIRFSITSLQPPTSRILPTIYQDRCSISLYDAQWLSGSKGPIPTETIKQVVTAFQRFRSTCEDLGVPEGNVRVLATEATRAAENSAVFREAILEGTGWEVEMLEKEEEGRVGAMGVVSSFESVRGLMMDLGGGSTQITWLISQGGRVRMSEAGSVSLPYGAAALSRRLEEAQRLGRGSIEELKKEITAALREAVEKIQIPREILESAAAGEQSEEGITLYLSGGGFRGWGFVLMSQHPVSPYPIPIINGFATSMSSFKDTALVTSAAAASKDPNSDSEAIFRVSDRRASQVPAVALLVSCMLTALPSISTVRFAQGGIREGALYMTLDEATKREHPFSCATSPFSTSSTPALLELLHSCCPSGATLPETLLTALGMSLYLHGSLPKDLKPAAALRSTTTGVLASVHGASHHERAALGIMLCERWGGFGDLPPGETGFYQALMSLLGREEKWWCVYFGRVGKLIGECYPAGVVRSDSDVKVQVRFDEGAAKKRILMTVDFGKDGAGLSLSEGVQKALRDVEKIGKKKNWPDGWGCKVDLKVLGETSAG